MKSYKKQIQKLQPSISLKLILQKVNKHELLKKDLKNPLKIDELDLGYLGLEQCCDIRYFEHLKTLKIHANNIPKLNGLLVPKTLIYLSLGSNSLESIEPLAKLLAPNLKTLNLYSNNICMISSLKKSLWPFFNQINLQDNNNIKDLETIAELRRTEKKNKAEINLASQFDKMRSKKIQGLILKMKKLNINIGSVIIQLK